MKDFRIAMAQINHPQINTVDQNIEKMRDWTRKAADQGADMIMFGELCVSGYLLDSSGLRARNSGSSEHYRRAEAVPGDAARRLEELAREYGVFIAAGMGDVEAGVVYNAYFMVGPDGYVGKQRKIHMPDVEYPFYGTGSAYSVFDIGLCKIGFSICFDNWFPETSRILAVKGAEVMLSPWMWIVPHDATQKEKDEHAEHRAKIFKRFFATRALDNAMYVMVLDHVGLEADGFEMPGVSIAFSPFGDVVAEGERFAEDLLLVDLKESEIEKYRTYGHHFTLTYRRPETYGELARMAP